MTKNERKKALQDLGLACKFILLEGKQGTARKYGLSLIYKGKSIYLTEYSQGSGIKESPNLIDAAYCLFSDASCYESSDKELSTFLSDLGYCPGTSESVIDGMKAFEGCKATYEALKAIPRDIQEQINKALEDY